jgi:predicted tellurium resistance membrane protein TerC
MQLLHDPQAWLSFLTLVLLEIVLGVDNVIFLAILVERLPNGQRGRARILGLGFAMLTRIGLLFCVTWMAALRNPLFTVLGTGISGRSLILFGGGILLVVQSIMEIREMLKGQPSVRRPGKMNTLWMIVLQIGILDIVFSLDSVFTAVGLSKHIEVMIAAIVVSVLVMMLLSSALSRFIDRHPTIKLLALAFLVLVGAALVAQSLDWDIPPEYLYFAFGFAATVEWMNIRLRRR